MLMNSFATSDDTKKALAKYKDRHSSEAHLTMLWIY